VNHKYGNTLTQLSYIDEFDEQITIDSDMVLMKAIQLALKVAYANQEKEVLLRLLIRKIACCKYLTLDMTTDIEYF
jgi:hypothetical protein